MGELKRNQRYFIEGRGEANEEESSRLDFNRDEIMSAVESFPETLEKTEDEKKLVGWVMEKVGKVAEFYGAEAYLYKPEHFHLFTNEAWGHYKESTGSKAKMVARRTGVYTGEKELRDNDTLDNAITIAHECFHLNGLNKITYREEAEQYEALVSHRSGVYVAHGPKKLEQRRRALRSERFIGLNEGMTQELARLFYARVIRKSDLFKDAVEEFDQNNPAEDEDSWIFPEAAARPYGWLSYLFLDICRKIKELRLEESEDIDVARDKFFKVYFVGDIKDLKSLLDIIGPGAFSDLSDIGASDEVEDLVRVKDFRKKFNLREDSGLEKFIEIRKQETKK